MQLQTKKSNITNEIQMVTYPPKIVNTDEVQVIHKEATATF